MTLCMRGITHVYLCQQPPCVFLWPKILCSLHLDSSTRGQLKMWPNVRKMVTICSWQSIVNSQYSADNRPCKRSRLSTMLHVCYYCNFERLDIKGKKCRTDAKRWLLYVISRKLLTHNVLWILGSGSLHLIDCQLYCTSMLRWNAQRMIGLQECSDYKLLRGQGQQDWHRTEVWTIFRQGDFWNTALEWNYRCGYWIDGCASGLQNAGAPRTRETTPGKHLNR